MSGNFWAEGIAIVSAAIAMVSVAVAVNANRRARDANDLQFRVDNRQREFRDVDLNAAITDNPDPEAPLSITVLNAGSTDAVDVVLVTSMCGPRQLLQFGTVAANSSKSEPIPNPPLFLTVAGNSMAKRKFWSEGYLLHWSSPLGHPDSRSVMGAQIL